MTDLVRINEHLSERLSRLDFSAPVAYVYNPLLYAWESHKEYLTRYGKDGKEVLLVGMNPGPWGMAQTGVPFGEVSIVRDWLKISASVGKPSSEHPSKRVEGFECRRSEVSGKRLWGMIRERFGEPGRFFKRFFVLNYCPLLFLDSQGRNITPDKLRSAERSAVLHECDQALRETVEYLRPVQVIGVGNFAANQAQFALQGIPISVGKICHPSPSNPAANRGWQELALKQLRDMGISV